MALKPSSFYRQSGVIPFRSEPDGLKIMLITSRGRQHWIIPKGIVEEELSAAQSAANEAYEEAGVRGVLLPDAIGEYDYPKWGGTCRVRVFLMRVDHVLVGWPESELRQRIWVSLEEAIDLVDIIPLKKLLRKLPAHLEEG